MVFVGSPSPVGTFDRLCAAAVAIYYNVIMSYCLRYIFACFTSKLPWEECGEWADEK